MKPKKRGIARRDIPPIKVWVTHEEKEVITALAKDRGVSVSAYIRNVILDEDCQNNSE